MTAIQEEQKLPNNRPKKFFMFDVSQDGANFWFDVSNILLLIGAIVVVFGTYGTIKFSAIKERFSDERISFNEAETKRAVAESDKANAVLGIAQADIVRTKVEIAEANERSAVAERKRAELEKQTAEIRNKVANRRITSEQNASLVEVLSKVPSIVDLASMSDSESGLYAADFLKTFEQAGWTIGEKTFPLGEVWIGLNLYQTDDPAILVIAVALTQANIHFSWANAPKTERAKILFGGRPPFF